MYSDVYIQKFRGNNGIVSTNRVVAQLDHVTNLDDSTPEVVKMYICGDYKGEVVHLPNVDDIHPLGERESHSLFPRIWFEAPTRSKLIFKFGNVIQKVATFDRPLSNKFPIACFYLSIDVPSDEPNQCIRFPIQMPSMNLKAKVLHIPEFDLFITEESNLSFSEKLSYGDVSSTNGGYHNTIKLKTNRHDLADVWYSLNRASPCKLEHEFDVFSHIPIIELTLGSGEVLTKAINLDFTETVTLSWDRDGGMIVKVDSDKDRLLQSAGTPLYTKDDVEKIIEELKAQLSEQEAAIHELEKMIKQKETIIINLNAKLAEATSEAKQQQEEYKQQQEEYKTRREELRYKSSRHEAESSLVLDAIKVAGALAGFGALLLTIFRKSAKEGINKLVEWGIPSFGFSSCSFTASISTATLVGGSIVIGLLVAAAVSEKACGFISSIYNGAKEAVLDWVGDGMVGTVVSAVCSVAETVASVVVSVVRKVSDAICEGAKLVGSAFSSCVGFIGGLFSW